MIEVIGLTKRYGENTVVNGLNFVIESGKIYGFLGPNGAGKSTTMNMITGCLAPTEGKILIDGVDIFDDPIGVKKCVGYLPENPPVYPDMTPEEYLTFVASAKGIKGRNNIIEQVYSVIDETNILQMKDRLIKNLSKGYRQRVGIAQAMLGDPKVIILDEPTVGLDPKQITEIRELIARLGKTRTVILSSHILAEVSAVCDEVMIINRGNLIASDTLENIRRDHSPENTLLLTAKASEEEIGAILSSFGDAVISYETQASGEDEGYIDVTVMLSSEADIRDELYLALAEKRIALRRFAKHSPSLEEIFLTLTDIGYDDDEAEGEDELDGGDNDADDEADDDEEDYEDDDDDEDGDDGEYKPLFGGSTDEEDE